MIDSKSQKTILETECAVFTQYLVSQTPNPYVLSKYYEAHNVLQNLDIVSGHQFDIALCHLARTCPTLTKIVDTYACFFSRRALIRKKLILLISILESCFPTSTYFEYPSSSSKLTLSMNLIFKFTIFLVSIVFSFFIIFPYYAFWLLSQKYLPQDEGLWEK